MKITSEQKEFVIANLLKCVDGLHMADVEILFDLARNKAFETSKVDFAEFVSKTRRNSPSTDLT